MYAALPSLRQSTTRTPDPAVAVVGPYPHLTGSAPGPRDADVTPEAASLVGLLPRVRAAVADPSVRVLVLDGLDRFEPPAALAELPTDVVRTRLGVLAALAQVLPDLPVPVVGVTAGAVGDTGCLLASCCDLVVAAPSSTFGLTGVRSDVPAAVPALALASAVGRRAAVAMATTGRPVTADRALALGLVTDLAASDAPADLDAAVADVLDAVTTIDATMTALGRSVVPTAGIGADEYEAAIEATMCAHEMATLAVPDWADAGGPDRSSEAEPTPGGPPAPDAPLPA